GLIIPGFECYFQRDDDDELYSDWYNDGEQTESDDAKIDNNVPLDVQDVVKQFLDSIAIDDESFRLPCYAHSIQLVINDGLKGSICVQPSLEKISKIAKLSHSSTAVAERLENIQVCVPNANKTRWNSQYDMVVTVIGIQPSALNDILIQTQHRELCLKSLDYQMLNEFVSLLTLFAEATTTTQAQKTPSVSIVAPSILAIYQDLLLERANVKHASSLCECLLESLLSRFGDPVFLVAPFLDGRFRLNWISKQCILIEQVNAPLGTTENDNSILSPTAQTQPLSASAATSPITPKRKYLFANIVKETKNLNDMVLLKPSNIYPTLSKLAMKFLSIPATSAPVERVFSQSGFLFRQHRASMTRTTLQQLTMLKCNRGLY
ncbi:unnamed protein product, partial [Rotaria socialis]